ncbi:MAG: hypothetical protein HXS41_11505 [Theionarchaea archaeon]|nr:hypothetical protein [Theionarchaea archaeon]MBU7000028.1 hypothetical protein [Theionarchaea archaeon]MBU7021674.1 hypothetical protein [Theionarchaea archaeon]MBU7034678.1 hypothetical protein [Theionarchaea archaeon]MBU7039339.1 hypothetical protein [Theionarchaea archaeon]
MRTSVILVLLVCCCIGSSENSPTHSCEKPLLDSTFEAVTLPGGPGLLFNGMAYSSAGECDQDVLGLMEISIPGSPWKVYTETESRNPVFLYVEKDDVLEKYSRNNGGKVLFLEIRKKREATQTSGGKRGGHEGSPVTYVYDPEDRVLRGNVGFPLDEFLMMVCGFFQEKTGDQEVGQVWYLYGITEFPRTISDVEILGVESDGTVHLFIFCEHLVIPAGESREVNRSFQEVIIDSSYVVVITVTIENYGVIDLESVVAE